MTNKYVEVAQAKLKEKLEVQLENSITGLLVRRNRLVNDKEAVQAKIDTLDKAVENLSSAYEANKFVVDEDIRNFVRDMNFADEETISIDRLGTKSKHI